MSNITTSAISRKMAKSNSQPILLSNKQIVPSEKDQEYLSNALINSDYISPK